MTQYYEIISGLTERPANKLVSSFQVLIPENECIIYYETDDSVSKQSTIRYYRDTDSSKEETEKGSNLISWDGQHHTVIIEINVDTASPGGTVSRKTDVAD